MTNSDLHVRPATRDDVPALNEVIDQAVRLLMARDYDPRQIEAALRHGIGLDTRLIDDGTYYVAEIDGRVVAGGGWSFRRGIYGGDRLKSAESDQPLDPARDAARIRAMFVHPDWARRGIGRRLMEQCEREARAAGFGRLELLATITGVPLYTATGFHVIAPITVDLPGGVPFSAVRMGKVIGTERAAVEPLPAAA